MAQAQLMRVAKMLKRHMDKVKSRPRGPAGGPAPKKKKMKAGGVAMKADINKNKKIEPWEAARSKAIAKSMAKKKTGMKKGGSASKNTHVTKEGKTAKKGLWYNIHQKRKRGETMRKKGAKGAPTAAAIRKSQGK
jgi:hypothetical protein